MSSAAKTRYRTGTRRFAKKNYIPEAQRQGFRAIKHSVKLASPQTLGNLGDLGKAFDAAGIGWWLSYGALLGIIRDGNFVPSDDDIGAGPPAQCLVHLANEGSIVDEGFIDKGQRLDGAQPFLLGQDRLALVACHRFVGHDSVQPSS